MSSSSISSPTKRSPLPKRQAKAPIRMRMGAFLRVILRQTGFGPPQEAFLETMQIRGSAMAGLKSACAGGATKREEGGVRGLAPARGSFSPRDGLSVLRSFSQMDCRRAVAAFAHGKCLRECAPCKRPPCCGQWDAPIARGIEATPAQKPHSQAEARIRGMLPARAAQIECHPACVVPLGSARRDGRGMRGRFCANGQARRQSAGYNHDC